MADNGRQIARIRHLFAPPFARAWTMVDCDATDEDSSIRFILPCTIIDDLDGDGLNETDTVSLYRVYLAGLGKPGDNRIIVYPEAQFYNGTSGLAFHEWGEFIYQGHKSGKNVGGQPTWYNMTDLFLADVTLVNMADPTQVVVYDDVWVFNIENLEGYWWQVANDGIKHLQIRFYPVFKSITSYEHRFTPLFPPLFSEEYSKLAGCVMVIRVQGVEATLGNLGENMKSINVYHGIRDSLINYLSKWINGYSIGPKIISSVRILSYMDNAKEASSHG